jgi:hypothetical protein
MPVLYAAARLMVCPSFYEGFGLPVAEAMACGCPVLCSWSSSLPEVAGDAAVYFRPRDAWDLASKARSLLMDEAALAAMSARGLVRVRRFSYPLAAERLLEILRAADPGRRVTRGVGFRIVQDCELASVTFLERPSTRHPAVGVVRTRSGDRS